MSMTSQTRSAQHPGATPRAAITHGVAGSDRIIFACIESPTMTKFALGPMSLATGFL